MQSCTHTPAMPKHHKRGGSGKGKFAHVMHEFHAGKLHSGTRHGPMVHSAAQAAAIAYSEQRRMQHHKRK